MSEQQERPKWHQQLSQPLIKYSNLERVFNAINSAFDQLQERVETVLVGAPTSLSLLTPL